MRKDYHPICRALISVSDKVDILSFAQGLSCRGIKIFSTGGTSKLLSSSGLEVTDISEYTGFPEVMNGRLKTLHPKVHGGILGRRDQDNRIMIEYGIVPIDIVVVNFYPFDQIISSDTCSLSDAIENIDIGGPAMVRSAAKNYKSVAIIISKSDYNRVLLELDENGNVLTENTRFLLAMKAFEYTTAYDQNIAHFLKRQSLKDYNYKIKSREKFPYDLNLKFTKKQDMRYGENSHQLAAFYIQEKSVGSSVSTAKQLQGKSLSYNNITDIDSALECVKEFDEPACVIVKHANPCGVSLGKTILEAYRCAYNTDPVSAFGGIIAFNCNLDEFTAKDIINRQFVEVIIAPSVSDSALKIISNKKNIRVLICGQLKKHNKDLNFRSVTGGLLVQDSDMGSISANQLHVVTKRIANKQEVCDALFCWKVVKFVKSNAIVYGYNSRTIGIGSGQTSRIDSVKIAAIKAEKSGIEISGSVMASDAFFPFRDSIDFAAKIGVRCVIQPGGSIHDEEIIDAANEYEIAMLFTNMRHFRH
ncbi:bifunctional phosphoribosylaminoimidazolecarboxamide formyltransferase/IMP cyclohydrolase [Candidatus Erwinia haradaeae]|uniref:Bifunctional purine biosynthesis protein PurH n=1 Tax=Candidatus Erwinia haradaeae TaxID=1922217 RepID=A0A451D2X8_9GAMM|nr:bifunctional phosphoribosylaminoimidazolecarboxamide formyltransferase/IMP cyclohydrolase [Candidatus Erwinia haradaeae]VFP80006.1 Bifunctional purine biosynthesis protein PurH [Candidatus Erwinia haradaeae]